MTAAHSAQLGSSVPIYTAHAVSVSLPTWQDNIDYELGLERVIGKLTTGYPRFFIHQDIQKLAEICRAAHALSVQERTILFPSERAANLCRTFVADQAIKQSIAEPGLEKQCRLVRFEACSSSSSSKPTSPVTTTTHRPEPPLRIYVLFVPDDTIFKLAKSFWQHTGLAPRRYNVKQSPIFTAPSSTIRTKTDENISTYVEERYGRNLPIQHVQGAKLALRRRIADILVENPSSASELDPAVINLKASERGTGQLNESDIYLYPTGMSSIFYAHQVSMSLQKRLKPQSEIGKSICFGFPYTDTLKIVEKWGPGAHFFGHGETEDLDDLEKILTQNKENAREPSIGALFCEFPSNPLLKSPDLIRLRKLADQHDFLIVIDETIGNFCNVEVLPYADILVSSLTKVFSGDSNVMGGSMIINPSSKHHHTLKAILDGDEVQPSGLYEDTYFGEDVIFMERNSRDFKSRVSKINNNALKLCEFLHDLSQSDSNQVIRSIQYPRYTTIQNYENCRRTDKGDGGGGYGGLFSIIFKDLKSSSVFYDNLKSFKGPSLGTNFTLSSPYVILAHFQELDWAAQFGVPDNLIRVSVGLEDLDTLLDWFRVAFEKANRPDL
ncbi:hypothetical protein PSTG_01778 [Puccinia striiformis f. sp. tritici PST-78]|uniref:cystathionine gamma-synthase n=1 Tax=Puccinia striiformis f. sp. tritici PST-78 TaxID=1165861 RepID=A0A0L0W0V4_9BASI|nr:hypothetical protein PSTG_01778 [Puccinia striiformis f. sp. tritici PST-78]